MLLDILMNTISRKYEYQADRFATEHGYGHHLKVALTKLNVENSSSIASHWLVSLVRNSHPSLLERCVAISAVEKKLAQPNLGIPSLLVFVFVRMSDIESVYLAVEDFIHSTSTRL